MMLYRYALLLGLLLAPALLLATEFRAKETYILPSLEQIDDDLVLTGKSLKLEGKVTGDVLSGCRSLSIYGTVGNSVFNGSQNLNLAGTVGGSVVSFCQDLRLSGKVGRNLTAFAATVTIVQEGLVGGELTLFCEHLELDGTVTKGVQVQCEEAVITGNIKGDVKITAEKLVIMEGAVIEGNLKYKSKVEAQIDPKAKITGDVKWDKAVGKEKKKGIYRSLGFFKLALMAGNLATGIVLIALFKRRWDRSQAAIGRSFLKASGMGFIMAVCVPIAAILLMITLIGIPLSFLALVGYGIVIYTGKLVFSTFLGNWILRLIKWKEPVSIYWIFIFGYLVFWVLTGFAFVGSIVYVLAFLAGFGGIVLGGIRDKSETAVPASPTTA